MSAFFLSLFLKISFHRFDDEKVEVDSVMDGDGSGSGSWIGGSAVEVLLGGSGLLAMGRRWRGRRTPSTNNSSAERRLGCGKEGFRSIQNSNSGELQFVLLGESVWGSIRINL